MLLDIGETRAANDTMMTVNIFSCSVRIVYGISIACSVPISRMTVAGGSEVFATGVLSSRIATDGWSSTIVG